jgi:uncharacterized membrane protein YtjA (UPF0391 family)
MLKWSLAFFILGIAAATFGFTSFAGEWSYVARIFLIVFTILFAVSLLASLLSRNGPALFAGARAVGLFAIAATIGVGFYAWVDNNMSAERVGRAIDRGVISARNESFQTIADLTSRATEATKDVFAEASGNASGAEQPLIREDEERKSERAAD